MPDKEGKHYSSLVWVEKIEDADKYMKLEKSLFERAVKERSLNALGEITLASTPECFPLKGIIAKSFTAPRTMLIAEAAHAMSPIGAQGLNLSLRDVATAAETIIDAARLGQDIGNDNVLNQYAKRRQLDIKTRFTGVDSYNRIVSNNIGLLRGMRRAGLKGMKSLPSFKSLIMEKSLSPAFDEGRIARGEAA
jgi:2-octaprenyl-6-methoxyphenol hydroxylase